MPLADTRDKHTEIIWGIKDFIYRFNRKPEGMWLPETAVDYETLDILSQHGILYTILAPHQAKQIRDPRANAWRDLSRGIIDTCMPYLCRLPTGRTINLFFYDEKISNEVAFGNLLENGDHFVSKMVQFFPEDDRFPRLLNIANDGETYGHHHRFADMALAYALHTIEEKKLAIITNYGEYLEKFPPTHEVTIHENTSWSCSHGVERWRGDCGCRTFQACLISNPVCDKDNLKISRRYEIGEWNQNWRIVLRNAMNWLNERLSKLFVEEGIKYFNSPERARNDYIDLILKRNDTGIKSFFSGHAVRSLNSEEVTLALKLLEMGKNSLLMMTSCGWFFDEISGIETIQVLMYACLTMQLAREISYRDFEPEYVEIMKDAVSNVPEEGNGKDIYNKYIKTSVIDIPRVAFHYAVTSLIEECPENTRINNFSVRCKGYKKTKGGAMNLCYGRALFRSDITLEESDLVFSVLHMGDHNIFGGVGLYQTEKMYKEVLERLDDAFSKSDVPGIIHCLDRQFKSHSYSIWDLFPDGRRKILYSILDTTLIDIENEFRQIYQRYYSLIKAMKEMRIKPPEAIEFPIRYIMNLDIRKNLESNEIDYDCLNESLNEVIHGRYAPDMEILEYIALKTVRRMMQRMEESPEDVCRIEEINRFFTHIQPILLSPDLWNCQNQYFRIGMVLCEKMHDQAVKGDEKSKKWLSEFDKLGVFLGVRSP